MQTYLRYAIYAGLFGVLFIPFIVSGDLFFPFITGKNFTFRIIVESIFALWLILAMHDASARPKKSLLLYALGAFVVSVGVSTLLAENPSKAFWSNFERMEGYITILHLGAYALVASAMVTTEKVWKHFWNTSIGVSVVLGAFGLLQVAGVLVINQGGVRVDATFGNATYLSVYMLFHVFLTLYALSKWSSLQWVKVAYAGALVLQVVMIFYTATRGTILGLMGGLFLTGLIFTFFSKEHPHLKKIGVGVIAALVLLTGGFFLVKDSSFVQNNPVLTRIASISLSEGQTRLTIWGMSFRGFQERPLFGWGQEGFNYVFNTQYEPSLYAQEPWFDRAHNIFFDWLVAGGVFGLALYLSFFAIPLWYLWRRNSAFDTTERALFTGLFAGYGFHNLFVFDNLMSYILFFSVLIFLLYRHREHIVGSVSEGKAVPASFRVPATVGVVAVLALVLYFANVPGITRAAGLIDAIRPHQEGITRNFEVFQSIISDRGLGRQEVHEQLLQFATQIRAANLSGLSTEAFRTDVARYARDEFQNEINRAPNDARLYVFYGSFLRQIGDHEGAQTVFARARELSPRKQNIYFEQAVLALDAGDQNSALTLFKDAYELDTSYDRARSLYAATLLRAGAQAPAEQLLLERYNTLAPDDDIILQAYIDIGATARVVAIAEGRVALNATNFDRRLQLAAAYLGNGQRTEAVQALREAIQLNPAFAEQGEFFISEIQAGRNP